MKQICEVVRDLLWLYEEGECSEGTRQFVESHLEECEECRRYQGSLKITEQIKEPVSDTEQEKKAIVKSFHKIRRRWIASVIAVLMIIPLTGIGILSVHEYQKEGICFSNIQEIAVSIRLVKLLEEEKFEEAAEMLDFNEERGMESSEEYKEAQKEDFIQRLLAYQEYGYHLCYRSFDTAYRIEDCWQIELNVIEEREQKIHFKLVLFVEGDSIQGHISSAGDNELIEEFLGRVNFEK